MQFTILNWNIGGAKFLEEKRRDECQRTREKLNRVLQEMIKTRETRPDVITLQEIVRYREPDDVETQDILDAMEGYRYFPFTLVDTTTPNSIVGLHVIGKKLDLPVRNFLRVRASAFGFIPGCPKNPRKLG